MLRFMSRTTTVLFFAACMTLASFCDLEAQEAGENGAVVSKEVLQEQIQAVTALDLPKLIEELEENWALYEKQLQSVLRTRLIEEKEFLARVILLVQQEHVPKNLVDSAWLWVRNNRRGTSYPFIYFERVLRLEAAKAKVALPVFDRAIYNNREAMRNRRLQERFRR